MGRLLKEWQELHMIDHPNFSHRWIFKLFFLYFFLSSSAAFALEKGDVVEWSSPEGILRLEHSQGHNVDFFFLANFFQTQPNKIFCGPTSASIVMNALRLNRSDLQKPMTFFDPKESQYLPKDFDPRYARYTPDNFFDAATEKIKTREEVLGKPIRGKSSVGLQLRELHKILLAHGLDSKLRIADKNLKDETIKKELIQNLSEKNNYILINYQRKELNQNGEGHISPLGAYDEASDSFLIMDVNPNTAPWVWVKSEALIRAMRTFDTIENRGYLLISEGKDLQHIGS